MTRSFSSHFFHFPLSLEHEEALDQDYPAAVEQLLASTEGQHGEATIRCLLAFYAGDLPYFKQLEAHDQSAFFNVLYGYAATGRLPHQVIFAGDDRFQALWARHAQTPRSAERTNIDALPRTVFDGPPDTPLSHDVMLAFRARQHHAVAPFHSR
ncbi:hypothetical protein QCD60_29330 [Pokkaliibacter sp. MBI-7]|uniref:hypothetical protein n=1 Tax=Pokkaliibacter sp. MBI-7 TaxID=3040600 RepID=UPI0024485FF2|nr:hypothetical protein [Pokkaliibacter sp. MBI-7]MDH2434843.1 hypothetical protein [Pokkaliibacter sp. MBI-7]MDH2436620.1 hypothetical protein [Pokkaliibacter sp. MBI-7]